MSSIDHMEWKIFIKATQRYTLPKKFFAVATFKGFRGVSFQTKWKKLFFFFSDKRFGLYEPTLYFQRREDQINAACGKWI